MFFLNHMVQWFIIKQKSYKRTKSFIVLNFETECLRRHFSINSVNIQSTAPFLNQRRQSFITFLDYFSLFYTFFTSQKSKKNIIVSISFLGIYLLTPWRPKISKKTPNSNIFFTTYKFYLIFLGFLRRHGVTASVQYLFMYLFYFVIHSSNKLY